VTAEAGTEHLGMIRVRYRCPQGLAVAGLAYIGCTEVSVALAGSRGAIVAGDTILGRRWPMNEYRILPRVRIVAIGTGITTCNVVSRFPRGHTAVMTAETATLHLCMIDPGRRVEKVCAVAGLAGIGRIDMAGGLAGRRGTVVTGDTISGHTTVIEHRPGKARGAVAVATGIVTGDVVGCLARRRGAVVTAETGAQDIGVINPGHRSPQSCVVTGLTRIGCLDMGITLACRRRTVMAGGTVPGDAGMVIYSRPPGSSGMAVITGITDSRYVIG